jgi:ABC-type cobalamin/Fe3+-siderophores transport system ATPase subunit
VDGISARDVSKRFRSVQALAGVSFDVERGEVVSLLGPNGAGKSTTIEILEGFRMRSAGEVGVLGVDPAKGDERWRARIGVVLQSWRDHGRWRVRDLLAHLGGYYAPYTTPERERPHDVDELLETVGLAEQAEQRLVTLSGGSAAAWTSPSAWWAGPSCCSSTSPPPGSTRERGGTSTTWCTACRTWRTPPSCSPPTTSPRPSSSPTGS